MKSIKLALLYALGVWVIPLFESIMPVAVTLAVDYVIITIVIHMG